MEKNKTIMLADNPDFAGQKWRGHTDHEIAAIDEIRLSVKANGETVDVVISGEQVARCAESIMFQSEAYVLSRMLRVAVQDLGFTQTKSEPVWLCKSLPDGNFGMRLIKSRWSESVSADDAGYKVVSPKEFARIALAEGAKFGI